jgi:hypothetical protein
VAPLYLGKQFAGAVWWPWEANRSRGGVGNRSHGERQPLRLIRPALLGF